MSSGEDMRCIHCQAETTAVVVKEHRERIGDRETIDKITWSSCEACKHEWITDAAWKAAELRAAMTVLRDLPSIDGKIMRSVRKILGLTQRELAEMLELDNATISRMESGAMTVQRTTHLALDALVEWAKDGRSLRMPSEAPSGALRVVA